MTTAPKPYYETPAGAPCKVRLYLGDCREILPLVAPPSPRIVMLSDNPYGMKYKPNRSGLGRRAASASVAHKAPYGIANRQWEEVEGDAEPFDPTHLLVYPRLLLWGWNHFADRVPPSPSMIVWVKRDPREHDDGADCEVAWTNFGGPARVFHHFWRGTARASETGARHLHPNQKPEAFYRWLFAGRGRGKPVVRRGDLVVSPYCGSDPEARVCIDLGINHVGIDVKSSYLDTVVKHRIEPALKAARQAELPGLSRRLQPRSQRPREEQTALVIP